MDTVIHTDTTTPADTDILTDTPASTGMKPLPLLYLLQISDPMLPIGGFTQSYGLETYVQKGIVCDAASSGKYLENYILHNFLYSDLLAIRLAWEYADKADLDALIRLDDMLCAVKAPRELRAASVKLGTRFSKIVENELTGNMDFKAFMQAVKQGKCSGNYSTIFGLTAKLFGIGKEEALTAVAYSTASSIVNNCAKLVPISQKAGQAILFGAHKLLKKAVEQVKDLEEEALGICCFGFDLRAMQHERLYTRIYIS